MRKRNKSYFIRKSHRYLGLFLGVQFLFWTVSGLYFSWTDIDEIHGDHFKNLDRQAMAFHQLISPSDIDLVEGIRTIELREINEEPYYWINDHKLINAQTGTPKINISKDEALSIAHKRMKSTLNVKSIDLISETDAHHEYRHKLLPAYVISYDDHRDIKAYVSVIDGEFQTVRHNAWRWFDFLWMTHTMDYEGRDNFNTMVLRLFSALGLVTVLSGFVLWFTSSPTIRGLITNK